LKRISLLAVIASLVVPAVSAGASGPPVMHFAGKSKVAQGFFQGRSIKYLDFGPIKLAPGNALAPIWVVTNGAAGQRNIVDTVPGRKGYSPLWQVRMVTWNDGVGARLLRSAAQVKAAEAAGDVTIEKTSTVVNCPVLGFGQKNVRGFYRGEGVDYYDLGPVKLKTGNKVAPIWAVTNGVAGQHNIVDTVPGRSDYTPLWKVSMVTFAQGVAPRLLTSAAQVKSALADGDVTIEQTSTVVNCPVL
jgi:hypothetical protein